MFSHDEVQEKVGNAWIPLMACAVAVFSLSPLLYEILRRIPFVRWAVLGEKGR